MSILCSLFCWICVLRTCILSSRSAAISSKDWVCNLVCFSCNLTSCCCCFIWKSYFCLTRAFASSMAAIFSFPCKVYILFFTSAIFPSSLYWVSAFFLIAICVSWILPAREAACFAFVNIPLKAGINFFDKSSFAKAS